MSLIPNPYSCTFLCGKQLKVDLQDEDKIDNEDYKSDVAVCGQYVGCMEAFLLHIHIR